MDQEWAVKSRRAALEFARDVLLYGIVIFLLLAFVLQVLEVHFAESLFVIWLVSTVVFAPLFWAVKNIFTRAWRRP